MYARILVPLDGSELAEGVLPYVKLLSAKLQPQIDLLRVIEPVPSELSDSAHGAYPHRISASIASHAQDYLEQVAGPLREMGLKVDCDVHEGEPASLILSAAARNPDTLLAMSTHGRTGITRWTMGSVTDKVLHAATVPLLVIRSPEHPADRAEADLKAVIVPLDGSSLAEGILPYLTPLASALNLKVTLLQVTAAAEEYYRFMDYPVGDYADVARDVDALAVNYLKKTSDRLKAEGVAAVAERLVHGHAAAAIIDLAEKTPDNLVAMGTHGRSGVGRWLLGSVTDQVVRHSGDPVLIIRTSN
ncbi:MAG: universal stress protein [Dehalococcoidia bacterium]